MILRAWQLSAAFAVALAMDGPSSFARTPNLGIGAPRPREPEAMEAEAADRVMALVTGTVYDSLAEGPLAGADVQLLRQGAPERVYDTRTDSAGRFSIADVDGGTYVVGFFHPRIDSLGIDLATQRITVSPAGRAELYLATPSRATLLTAVCPDTLAREDGTLLLGMVRSSVSGAPLSGATVSVQWSGLAFGDSGGLSAVQQGVLTPVSPEGRFAVCNVPADAGVTLRAAVGPDTSGTVVLTFPPLGIMSYDVYVAPVRSDEGQASTRLTGRVTGRAGTPIVGARVTLAGWESATRTDSTGRFAFAQVPGGSTTLHVSAPGIEPVRMPVDLRTDPHARNVVTIVATPAAQRLAPVTVVDRRPEVLLRSGFEQRRRSGLGRFVDEAMLQKMPMLSTTSVLAQYPGMITRQGARGTRLFMRDQTGRVCTPTIWVDGTQYRAGAEHEGDGAVDIDLLADPTRIAGIEIYRRVNQAPLQFAGTTQSSCGVIVIWRKER
jgi:Carboxypeptidase regulatory-like domain